MSVNKVILLGSVGRNPEVKEFNGAKNATFSLATNESYKDKNGEWQTNTEWHNIVCWRNAAEYADKHVTKGSRLYVEGSIRTRSWDGQDGSKKYVTEIVATHIQLTGKKENSSAPADTAPQRPQPTPLPPMGDDDDSDLPF